MNAPVPRLRVFAGPNGSGKSTIKEILPPQWLGVYVNADEIEKSIRVHGFLDLSPFEITATCSRLQAFLRRSTLLIQAGLNQRIDHIELLGNRIVFGALPVNSYWASALSDFIRHQLLEARISFTFETVMSSPDKVAFMQKAQQSGYRTYLYYLATEDPEINIARVQHRVATGGHPVPEDKIVSRYARSLDLLLDAVSFADRAYIFDNSGHEKIWIAEVTNGEELEIRSDQMPAWFKEALWDRFDDPVSP